MLRNIIDYHLYIFKIKRIEKIILLIDTVLFILSTRTLINEWASLISQPNEYKVLITLAIGSIIKFTYDLYKTYNDIKESMDLRYGYISNDKFHKIYGYIYQTCLGNFRDSDKYKIIEIPLSKPEYIIIDKKVDNALIENMDIRLQVCKAMEKNIKRYIKKNSHELLPFLRYQYRNANFNGRMFFNEQKFCLSSDIRFYKEHTVVSCHKGSYYDTFLTNIVSGKEIRNNRDNKLISSLEEAIPVTKKGDTYTLKDITQSMMNNEVGVSTLGITKDNYLILWTQNRISQSSGGLRVPTGSGSADWKDMKNDKLTDTIINSMNRELWEESGGKDLNCSYNEIGETRVIGHFRWVKKGGKSEFVGVTKFNKTNVELFGNESEVYGKAEFQVRNKEELKATIKTLLYESKDKDALEKTEGISVPLYANLTALEEYIDKKDSDWLFVDEG